MLKVIPSNHFRKDLKLAKKRGLKIEKLAEVINTLASGETLAEKYRDHGLTGNYEGFRECHIEPDWLLIYRVESCGVELFLFRTGTHAALF